MLVVYGGKYCYVNAEEPTPTMQNIIEEQGPGVARIQATHCMDMIAGEELMGEKFMNEQPARYVNAMEKARDKLVEKGCNPNTVRIKLIEDPYPTIAEGIIDQYSNGNYSMLVIGRKRMSKAEEFV